MAATIYTSLLLIGALGLLAQALLGFAHGHGGDHAGHGGHGTHVDHGGHADHGHAGTHAHAGQEHAGHSHGDHQQQESRAGLSALWTLLSPLTVFSLCVGAGAAGLIASPYLSPLLTILAAVAGGAVFYGLLVRPIWSLIFKFASEPSRALAGSVAAPAEVLTRFDSTGKGLVRLTIDGQIVRVLAHLETDEQSAAGSIQPGDKVVVTSVDGRTNTCRVSRL